MDSIVKIGYIYPELLNMYGDFGNILSLSKRLEWRDIQSQVIKYKMDDEIDFENIDILYLGGGGEKEILLAKEKLLPYKERLKNYVENGGVLLCVCSGFDIIGEYFHLKGEKYEGLNIIPVKSEWGEKRFVSDVILDTKFGKVVGFENHNGRMNTGILEPLGEVIFGNGNNGEDKGEGVIYKNTFCTYLDGPLLPKNPALCDEILKRAIKKYDDNFYLKPLDDSVEEKAQNFIIDKYKEN